MNEYIPNCDAIFLRSNATGCPDDLARFASDFFRISSASAADDDNFSCLMSSLLTLAMGTATAIHAAASLSTGSSWHFLPTLQFQNPNTSFVCRSMHALSVGRRKQ